MIEITDNDLPITVAHKIVSGLKPVSTLQNAMCKALCGEDSNGQDMFDLKEINEIADYLYVYVNSHKNGD